MPGVLDSITFAIESITSSEFRNSFRSLQRNFYSNHLAPPEYWQEPTAWRMVAKGAIHTTLLITRGAYVRHANGVKYVSGTYLLGSIYNHFVGEQSFDLNRPAVFQAVRWAQYRADRFPLTIMMILALKKKGNPEGDYFPATTILRKQFPSLEVEALGEGHLSLAGRLPTHPLHPTFLIAWN